VLLALAGVAALSPHAVLSTALDGLAAGIVVAPAVLAGLWLVPLLMAGHNVPTRWHLLLGAVFGLGAASLLVLAAGLAGILQRSVWVVIIVVLTVAGVMRLRSLLEQASGDESDRADRQAADPGAYRYLWFLLAPFLTLALCAAANAPGLIWQEEGWGYDALEYHLQMPKEYLAEGRIEYAPHNVYANFPANVEMLYLLSMVLLNDDLDMGTTANMIHLLFAVLTVFGAWVVGRDFSPRVGILCAVTLGTAGWLCYLCGLAYVENGMLFFGLAATGSLLRGLNVLPPGGRGLPGGRWIALAGVGAGLACGCKYTALPMIALPLVIAASVLPRGGTRPKVRAGLVFGVTALLAFSPWLIKNFVMTGNPVFPLANGVFKASPAGWGSEEARWTRGHTPPSEERTIAARLDAFWKRVPGDHDQRVGPALLLLALAGLVRRRLGRADVLLLIMLLVQFSVWIFATHLYARFAVVMLIPLGLLAGRAVVGAGGVRLAVAAVLIGAGAGWNFAFAAKLHHDESPGGAPAGLIYKDGWLKRDAYFPVVNYELSQDARLLLVGDARAFYFIPSVDYCVVFNTNPFIEAIRSAGSDGETIGWLRERGYTHLLVHWTEIDRLRRSRYGFPPDINEGLFERLGACGLSLMREFEHPGGPQYGRYVTLYEVPAG
jgi:hypothetical protein